MAHMMMRGSTCPVEIDLMAQRLGTFVRGGIKRPWYEMLDLAGHTDKC
jgi:hypothetical protein